ncbi:hypothetical protein [Paracidovorax citrulli]|uniref:hypothetical protein n=1 Tax=Paracidovorax citrulli TaxID=80869 RepID=UPI001F0DA22D|nr:hypothetical protein [Paracidovorax citrulli]
MTGRESITGLADDLDDVAKVLTGDLAKSAQGAAARLRELADQDQAITAFLELQNKARDAGRALKAAETEAANYGRQITAMGPPTAQEAAAQQRLQAAVDTARVAFTQEGEAIGRAQASLQQFGVSGQNARDAQQRPAAGGDGGARRRARPGARPPAGGYRCGQRWRIHDPHASPDR